MSSRQQWARQQRRLAQGPQDRKLSPASQAKQAREEKERRMDAARIKLLSVHRVLSRTKDPIGMLATLEAKKAAALAYAGKPILAAIVSLPMDDHQISDDVASERLAIPQREFPLGSVDADTPDLK